MTERDGELSAEVRSWHPQRPRFWVYLSFIVAFDLALALGVRYALVVADSWTMLLAAAIVAVPVAIGLHLGVAESVLNRGVYRVTADALLASWGPVRRREIEVPRERIRGLKVDVQGRRADLHWVGAEGAGERVARLPAEDALPLADVLGRALERPVERPAGELPPLPPLRVVLMLAVTLGFSGYAIRSLLGPADPDLVAQVVITSGAGSAAYSLGVATRAGVWVRASWVYAEPVHPRRHMAQLPHGFALRVRATPASGAPVAVECDPFEVARFVNETRVSLGSGTTFSWFGQLSGCGLSVPAGAGTLEAELVPREGAARYEVERTEVLLRR